MKIIAFLTLITKNVNGETRYCGDVIFDKLKDENIDECLKKVEYFLQTSW